MQVALAKGSSLIAGLGRSDPVRMLLLRDRTSYGRFEGWYDQRRRMDPSLKPSVVGPGRTRAACAFFASPLERAVSEPTCRQENTRSLLSPEYHPYISRPCPGIVALFSNRVDKRAEETVEDSLAVFARRIQKCSRHLPH